MKNMTDKQIVRAIREPDAPATPAQLRYIEGLNLAVSSGITKSEAAVLIHNATKGGSNESKAIVPEKA
jgi:hypothetical protein